MTESAADTLAPLRLFVQNLTTLINSKPDSITLLNNGRSHLQQLIETDTWLPDLHGAPRNDRYAQHLLHCDPLERFSVVSFAWGPGQTTPIHNHTVWGLVGILRGKELSESYELRNGLPVTTGSSMEYAGGHVYAFSPTTGDWHRVTNTSDQVAISIHVYGGNIGVLHRKMLNERTGSLVDFVSGYENASTPNLWARPCPKAASLS